MIKNFYSRLAIKNIKTNKRLILPYILSSIIVTTLFYILTSLAFNNDLKTIRGGEATTRVLKFGVVVLVIFITILMFYTHSFLIKKRTKEFGLYAVLGMTKKQIFKIITIETSILAIINLVIGVVCGISLDKIAYLTLIKLVEGNVKFGFELNFIAVLIVVATYIFIYFLIYINTLFKIYRLNIISLLQNEKTGEKEPKANFILVLLGVILIGYGYYTSLVIKTPVEALTKFFYAVLAVIIGTYLLFTVITIFTLKVLKNKKSFYYKTKNFIGVSNLLFRMKRNAVGLANICILSTMILVTLGSTSSLYFGKEDLIKTMYARNYSYNIQYNATVEEKNTIKTSIDEKLNEFNLNKKEILEFEFLTLFGKKSNNNLKFVENINDSDLSKAASIVVLSLDDYNKNLNQNETLEEHEILFKANRIKTNFTEFNVHNLNFKIKKEVDELPGIQELVANVTDSYYIVVKDKNVIEKIQNEIIKFFGEEKSRYAGSTYYYGFNTDINNKSKEQINKIESYLESIAENFNKKGNDSLKYLMFSSSIEGASVINNMFATFFFIGIFISLIFIVAQIVIMYYKQISEGYEDKERFSIMQKVGLEDRDIKKSIKSQILLIFFAPIFVALVHVMVAYPFIEKILKLFSLTNTKIFLFAMIITFVVFALFYTVMYSLTSKTYYKIIKNK